jgi:hypothetical protein
VGEVMTAGIMALLAILAVGCIAAGVWMAAKRSTGR